MVSISNHDDLCNWEFINQSDFELDDAADDDSIYEVESIDSIESLDSFSSSSLDHQEDQGPQVADHDAAIQSPQNAHVDFSVKCARVFDLGPDPDINHDLDCNFTNHVANDEFDYTIYYRGSYAHDDDVVDDDDDYDDVGYGIDDELVPWEVKDRFERQRMRKLGERAFAKMTKSKKSAYLLTRPGCVRGKHGLGLKAC